MISILKVEHLKKSYGNHVVLDDISFVINEPQIIAIIGPNGSGKSTLLNILANLLKPNSGHVHILGKPNTDPSIFKDISFMQDNSVLYDYLTGYDHLQFIADVQGLPKEKIIETAKTIGNDSYLNKKVKNYSLGMKQRLLLAMAIVNQPKLLILDEPLNGLDPTSAIKVRELLLRLHQEGTTILLSSHNLGEIDRVTSNILFLKKGHLIKEDLSQFVESVYFLTVSNKNHAIQLLNEQKIKVESAGDFLKLYTKKHTIGEILTILHMQGIEVLDIEKHVTGAEERYQQIFNHPEANHATL